MEMFHFGNDPHVQMQRVEQIKDMSAAAWTALGMSDYDIMTVEVGCVQISSLRKWMSFRKICQQTISGCDRLHLVRGHFQDIRPARAKPCAIRRSIISG